MNKGQAIEDKVPWAPIVVTSWVKHEDLGFDGKDVRPMTIKIVFMKAKYMLKLACSIGEIVAIIVLKLITL